MIGFLCLDFKQREKDCFSSELVAEAKEGEGFPIEETLFSCPFFYLGHGTQAIAFESEDGCFVLKFFLKRGVGGKKRYRIFSPLDLLPSHRRSKEKKKEKRHERSLEAAMDRYEVAFRELKEETALLGLHLNRTHNLPQCLIFDRYGKKHRIDLDGTAFVLQKKAKLMREKFCELKGQDEIDRAIEAIEDLLERRARKGFKDLKGGFLLDGNYGFVGDRAIFLDPGRIGFFEEIKRNPKPEIERMKKRLWERLNS